MKSARPSPAESLRLFFRLARIANLPTVWSNCLAGWWLGGAGTLASLAWLMGGASCLYVGGMFLNDAVDAEWDRAHRPERPIPAGAIGRRTVWVAAGLLLVCGSLFLLAARLSAGPFAAGLVLAIVVYNWLHKHTAVAPLLMAACRALLYCTAGASAANGMTKPVLVGAAAMAGYVAGLSFFARGESTSRRPPRWPAVLIFAPLLLMIVTAVEPIQWTKLALPGAAFLIWSLASAGPLLLLPRPEVGRSVSGLLAGIPLLDWFIAAANLGQPGYAFALFFVAARALQRLAPAT